MYLVFDIIIFGFLAFDAILAIILGIGIKRSPYRRGALFALGVLAWLVVFYGSFIEPRLLVNREQYISLAANPTETLRVALVADFHFGPYKKAAFGEKVTDRINKINPDLILLAGDLFFEENIHIEYLNPLRNLRAKYGVYAVFGNHDYEEDFEYKPNFDYQGNSRVLAIEKALKEAGITILRNTAVAIKTPRKQFVLGGTDEWWTRRADPEVTFQNANPSLPKILLSHNPDVIHEAVKENVNLVLAAHTHGGQIRLPLIGSVAPIPDKLGRRYDRGLFQFGKTQLFITSGVGESGPRARLLVPPEIVLLHIKL